MLKQKILDVRIKVKCKITRKLTIKDNNTTVLSMSMTRLKVPDSFLNWAVFISRIINTILLNIPHLQAVRSNQVSVIKEE